MKILSLTLLLLSPWAAYSEDCTGASDGCKGQSLGSSLGQRDDITCCESSCDNGARKSKEQTVVKADSTSTSDVLDD